MWDATDYFAEVPRKRCGDAVGQEEAQERRSCRASTASLFGLVSPVTEARGSSLSYLAVATRPIRSSTRQGSPRYPPAAQIDLCGMCAFSRGVQGWCGSFEQRRGVSAAYRGLSVHLMRWC